MLLRIPITVLLLTAITAQQIELNTPIGKFLGSTLTSRLGNPIYAFRGIRYAEAPRFQAPNPIKNWPRFYNATTDGPVCPQPGLTDPISEDCLMLNIYTNQNPNLKITQKRPVIIHLHPGGFYSATGRSNWAGPHYFMDENIILITLNYRIGSLGFLSVGKEIPGNNGLKDQVIAMKWIKENIEFFGGDCNSITLFGYSAGAWSITFHMVSPMSRGLFHKAIISSGAGLGHLPLPKNQIELAKKQARFVGCPNRNLQEMIKCLKDVPAEDLGNSFSQFAEFGFDPILIWSPVIEENFGQERFLTDDPIKLIQNGNFEKIPIISGITKDEFAGRAITILANESLVEEFNKNFEKNAPIAFIYERNTNKSREVSRKIQQFYLNNKPVGNDSLSSLANIYSDSIVGFPVNRAVDLISKKSNQPVFYYKFSYQGRFSHFYLPESNGTVPYGVVHHDDLIYLFYISPLFPFFNDTFPEAKMVEKLTALWASFAKTGNPTNENFCKKFHSVKWIPYSTTDKKYLDIGSDLVLKENLFEERYSFWRDLYPL